MVNFKRFIAFYIDMAIASVLTIVPGVIFEMPKLAILIFAYILICFKDVSGKSIGKRIMRLDIVNCHTFESLSNPLGLVVRNITVCIWPIEALIAFFNSGKRLGDLLVGSFVK